MDILELIEKVKTIKNDVEARINSIKSKYNVYANRINSFIDRLEEIINNVIEDLNAGIAGALDWANGKIQNVISRINEVFDNMEAVINEKLNELQIWLDNVLDKIKLTFVQNSLAKLGMNVTKETAQSIADAIPLEVPTIDASIFNFELPLPDLTSMLNIKLEGKELPRMSLL